MGIQALEGLVPAWHTPAGQVEDDPANPPTRFKCKPLDGDEYAEVADHVRLVNGLPRITATGQKLCLMYGLVDWENFKDSSGKVEFMAGNFRLIPYLERTALTSHIFNVSSLSGEQEKNS